MSTVVYEQLIPRKNRRWQTVVRVAVVEILTFIAILGLFSGIPLLFLATLFLGFLAWYFLFPLFRVEYEYTLVGRDLQIDVIYGERRRKDLISIDLSKAKTAPGEPVKKKKEAKMIGDRRYYDATGGMKDAVALEIRLSGEYRYEKVWIEPDENLLQMMRPWVRTSFD